MALKSYSAEAIRYAEVYLRYFAEWAEERGVKRPADVTRDMLARYQRHVFLLRRKNGKPLGTSTQARRLQAVRGFLKWAARNNLVLFNPAAELELPRRERGLPKVVPSPQEMERILTQPDLRTPLGVRAAPCSKPCTPPACDGWSCAVC